MKFMGTAAYGVAFYCGATMLAGCGGAPSQAAATGPLPQPAASSLARASEVLTASKVSIKSWYRRGEAAGESFKTGGRADGPFPGIFVASGSWGVYGLSVCAFNESFTITSGSSSLYGTISGSGPVGYCSRFGEKIGPISLEYEVGNGNTGRVTIKIIRKHAFHETFFNLGADAAAGPGNLR